MCYRSNGKPKVEIEHEDDEDEGMEENGYSGANEVRMDTSEKRAPKGSMLLIAGPDAAEYMTFLKRRRAAMSDERARQTYERPS